MAIIPLNQGYFGQAAAARRAALENEKDRKARREEQIRGFGMDLGKTLLTQTPFAIADAVDASKRTNLTGKQTVGNLILSGLDQADAEDYGFVRGGEPVPSEPPSGRPPSLFRSVAEKRMPARSTPTPAAPPSALQSEERPMSQGAQLADDMVPAAAMAALLERDLATGKQGPRGAVAPPRIARRGPSLPSAVGAPAQAHPPGDEYDEPGVPDEVEVPERYTARRTVAPGQAGRMPAGYAAGSVNQALQRAGEDQFASTDLKRAQAENLRQTEDERVTLAKVEQLKAMAEAARRRGDLSGARQLETLAQAQLRLAQAAAAEKRAGTRRQDPRMVTDEYGRPVDIIVGDVVAPTGGRGSAATPVSEYLFDVPVQVWDKRTRTYKPDERGRRVRVEDLANKATDLSAYNLSGEDALNVRAAAKRLLQETDPEVRAELARELKAALVGASDYATTIGLGTAAPRIAEQRGYDQGVRDDAARTKADQARATAGARATETARKEQSAADRRKQANIEKARREIADLEAGIEEQAALAAAKPASALGGGEASMAATRAAAKLKALEKLRAAAQARLDSLTK